MLLNALLLHTGVVRGSLGRCGGLQMVWPDSEIVIVRWGIEKWPQESRTTNLATNGVGESKREALSIAFKLTCPALDII